MSAIRLAKGCSPAVAIGLLAFASALTASHTITSRRYSVWSALRKHVDAPFHAEVATLAGSWNRQLLVGFKPSEAWRTPPPEALSAARADDLSSAVLNQTVGKDLSRAETVLLSLNQWAECLRLAIRSSDCDRAAQADQLRATLDSIRMLLTDLRTRRPAYGVTEQGDVIGDAISRSEQHTYCELCWRESLRTAALRNGRQKARARRLSSRFCVFHDPRDPSSRYRADMRYKAAFERELDALLQVGESDYSITFSPPRSADEQEVRKTAYDLVHARLRPLNSRAPGARERVVGLVLQGLKQSEVARQLGVTRQAVSKAVKSFERLAHARSIDAELSPRTGESLALSGEAGLAVGVEIAALKANDRSPAQIAKALGRFRHSIDCLLAQD